MASSPSPGAVPTTPQATPPLPSGWVQCTDPTHGVPYYFDLERKCSQWEFPSAPSAAPTPPAAMPTSVATSEYSLDMSAAADEGGGASRDEPEGFADFGAFATAAAAPAGELSSPLLSSTAAPAAPPIESEAAPATAAPAASAAPTERAVEEPSPQSSSSSSSWAPPAREFVGALLPRLAAVEPAAAAAKPAAAPADAADAPATPAAAAAPVADAEAQCDDADGSAAREEVGCQSDAPPTRGAAAQTEVDAAAAEEEAEAAEAERARVAGLRRRCERLEARIESEGAVLLKAYRRHQGALDAARASATALRDHGVTCRAGLADRLARGADRALLRLCVRCWRCSIRQAPPPAAPPPAAAPAAPAASVEAAPPRQVYEKEELYKLSVQALIDLVLEQQAELLGPAAAPEPAAAPAPEPAAAPAAAPATKGPQPKKGKKK